jgi:hypothetical protein
MQALGMRPVTVFVVGIGNERADGEAASGAPASPSRTAGSDGRDIVPARNDVGPHLIEIMDYLFLIAILHYVYLIFPLPVALISLIALELLANFLLQRRDSRHNNLYLILYFLMLL